MASVFRLLCVHKHIVVSLFDVFTFHCLPSFSCKWPYERISFLIWFFISFVLVLVLLLFCSVSRWKPTFEPMLLATALVSFSWSLAQGAFWRILFWCCLLHYIHCMCLFVIKVFFCCCCLSFLSSFSSANHKVEVIIHLIFIYWSFFSFHHWLFCILIRLYWVCVCVCMWKLKKKTKNKLENETKFQIKWYGR